MGNLLVAPITEKETHRGVTEDGSLEYAVSSMQGWRIHMEDAHICEAVLYAEEEIVIDTMNDTASAEDQEVVSGIGHLSKKAKTMDDDGDDLIADVDADADTAEADADADADATTSTSPTEPSSTSSLPNGDDGSTSPNAKNSTSDTTTTSTATTNTTTQTYRKMKLEGHSIFSVFDGHGGSFAAEYSGLNFVRVLSRQPSFVKYARLINDVKAREDATLDNEDEDGLEASDKKLKLTPAEKAQIQLQMSKLLEGALRDAFLDIDREIWREVHGYGNKDAILPMTAMAKKNKEDDMENDNDSSSNGDGQSPDGNGDDEKFHDATGDEDEYQQKQDSGTTAVTVMFTPQWIICANAGDSRSVYSKQGNCTIPLSYDHKPDDEAEERRIYDAGGFVRSGRVEGDLAVSRGLGDFRFKDDDLYEAMGDQMVSFSQYEDVSAVKRKKRGEIVNVSEGSRSHICSPVDQKVSPMPDIIVQNRNPDTDEFVVVACDGIFDVCSNQECIGMTADIMEAGEKDLGLVCEEILDCCLEKGSKDNMTALVVKMPAQKIGQGGGVAERRRLRAQAAANAER
jgi:serine/threonine protein phosphatase PrpC